MKPKSILSSILGIVISFSLICMPKAVTAVELVAEGIDITPDYTSFENVNPGESRSVDLTVTVGDRPITKADVIFAIDLTGSMGSELTSVKNSSITIMEGIRAEISDTWFGVASFMDYNGYYSYPGYADYYGSGSDYPFRLDQDLVENMTHVSTAINGLALGYGNDGPEDYTRVLHEMLSMNWRSSAKRIVILFGDAPTHDLDFNGYNFGGDPGPDAIAGNADDLDFETVVAALAENNITVIAVDSSGGDPTTEATFKGMSIGYSGAAGTEGKYYLLPSASEIPAAIAQLIWDESQTIDTLSLEVSGPNSEWASVEPASYADVPANSTRSFTVTVTVPEATVPGFYPFVLQAMSDSNLAALAYLDISLTPIRSSSDLGFRPSEDGYQFENFTENTLPFAMFEQFFTTANVRYENNDIIGAAQQFYNIHYRVVANKGACAGFEVTSLVNYKNLTQSNAGPYALAQSSPLYSVEMSDSIRNAILFAQGIQMGPVVNLQKTPKCEDVGNSPNAYLQQIKLAIQNDSPVFFGISWDAQKLLGLIEYYKAGAHALLPYRWEDDGNETHVYVYDSNYPGEDGRYVTFDRVANTWSYQMVDDYRGSGISIVVGGGTDACRLWVIPLGLFLESGLPWWDVNQDLALSSTLASTEQLTMITMNEPLKLLITDTESRRLGWDGDTFYDEMPDGNFISTESGAPVGPGAFVIPADLAFTVKAQGFGDGTADIGLWKGDVAVTLSQLTITADDVFHFYLSEQDTHLTMIGESGDITGSLLINHLLGSEDQTASVQNLSLTPGKRIDFSFLPPDFAAPGDPANFRLETSDTSDENFNLSLQRSGGSGFQTFGFQGALLSANSAVIVPVYNWDSLPSVPMLVDLDKDGDIDSTFELINESVLAAIEIQVSPASTIMVNQSAHLTLLVRDQFEQPAANNIPIHLTATSGTLSITDPLTSGGQVNVDFFPEGVYGTVTIEASSGGVSSTIQIEVLPFQVYLPVTVR